MKIVLRYAAIAAALGISACGSQPGNETAAGNAAAPATDASAKLAGSIAPPAGTTWTETVAKTPEGGFVMGNPDAKVKLVEYASFTCSHCADFSALGLPTLKNTYVESGLVSVEFRNYVRDPIDVAIGLLARCQGPGPQGALAEQAFAAQPQFLERAQKLTEADQQRIGVLPPGQQFAELAKLVGVDTFFRQRGLPAAKQAACLDDKAALDELVAMRDAGTKKGINGTPMFLINDQLVPNASNWATLEPALKAAVAG